jgi:MoaA/NifB/PqqE/SkfB family radical SAM enzyme
MKKILIIDADVPQKDIAEGRAVYEAVMTGKCDVCPYLKQCEGDGNFRFPQDAACMRILNESRN